MTHRTAAFASLLLAALAAAPVAGRAAAEEASDHPRLFFAASDVPRLREQARTTHARIAANIVRQAEAILAKPVPPYPEKPNYTAFTEPTELPIPVALAWVLTGEQKYLDRTREQLVSFARWPHWGNERSVGQRDYALAWMLRACAVAYDWTYGELPDKDRQLIREALGRRAQEVYEAATAARYNREWENWWRTSYLQNHWHHCVFPLGLAALALEGEDPRAAEWLKFAERSARLTSDVLKGIGDGTWHEGPHYQDGMLGTIVPFYLNLKRLKGTDLLDEGYMRNYVLWRVYNHVPGVPRAGVLRYSSFVPQWGGCITGGGHATLRYIASRYGDGRAQWLADGIAAKEPGLTAPLEFFYYDPSVAPMPPDGLPLDRTLPDLEGVLWRTGWGDDDLAFALKTGAYGGRWVYERLVRKDFPFDAATGGSLNAGHDHADANTFSLFWGKMELAGEMPDRVVIGQQGGIGSTTAAHNTLLVDGRGQMHPGAAGGRVAEKTDGRLELVCGAGRSSYLVADATNRYREVGREGPPGELWLREFRRHVLFDKPRYLLMIDDIRSAAPHDYEWVCHLVDDAPTDRVTVEDGWVRSPAGEIRPGRPWSDPPAGDARMLGIRVLAPEGFRHEAGESRYFTTFRPPKHKIYVKLRPPRKTADVRFVTVFFPTKSDDWDRRPQIELLADTEQVVGVRVALDGQQDHVVALGTAAEAAVGDYRLAGRAATVARDASGRLARVFMAQGTRLSDDSGRTAILQAAQPTTVEAVYGDGTLALTGEGLAGLRVRAPGVSPEHVTVNGKVMAADAGIVLLP
ncbi:MAG: DUF4962 domain-containing protein [Planctomycetes bacterium]|nr:DUF4962 domain-containing protein [Planctomycetota bacterium]